MKKIYIFLLLITKSLSLFCMETTIINSTNSKNNDIPREKQSAIIRSLKQKKYNEQLKKELYDHTYHFCVNKETESELISLVSHINGSMKKNQLTEDILGTFAYEKKDDVLLASTVDISQTILFFSCLKQYNSEVQKKEEPYPYRTKNLTQALGITSSESTPTKSFLIFSPNIQNYPCYLRFIYSIRNLLRNDKNAAHKKLIDYLYLDKSLPKKKYSPPVYNDISNDFYKKAYSYVFENGSLQDIYDLLDVVDYARESQYITEETKIGYDVLHSEPTNARTLKIFSCFAESYAIDNVKNKISLLCPEITTYNNARGDKITPTPEQYNLYKTITELNIALPDGFDKSLFDENDYAFTAFEELLINTQIVMHSTDQEVQSRVTQIYGNKDLS